MKKTTSTALLLLIVFLTNCGTYSEFENSATKHYSREDKQKFAKYMVQGKILYKSNCSNCHQEDGTGLGKLIPPLAKSDYMLEDESRTICIIKNGLKGEILVNGQKYNQPMVGFKELTKLEMAMLTTYLYNTWGAERGLISQEKITNGLADCD